MIEQKGSRVGPALQRSFKHTMKSRLRTRFNVQKTSLIPADQLADACNFIAAYALEGEWLPRLNEQAPVPALQLDINFPVSRWLAENPALAKIQEHQAPGSLLITASVLCATNTESPTLQMIDELNQHGFNIEACLLEVAAMRHHLEELSSKIADIQRISFFAPQIGVRLKISRGSAA